MASIYNWSITANSNSNSDSGINWAEGQLPGTVNGSARAMMGRFAEFLADQGGALAAGGTANALTVTANSAFTAYADGLMIALRITTDNTTAATLNVNAIGAKSIRKMVAAGESALEGAEMQATGICLFRYSTALNAAAGGWQLLNPAVDYTVFATKTGVETLTNKTLTSPAINTPTITGGTSSGVAISTATITQPTLTLKQSATPTPTAEGDIQWDTDDNVLAIGDGAATQLFLPAPASVAAGDVFYATGAKVLSRLAKGAAGQILTMNSGATAPQWSEPPVKFLTSGTVAAAAAVSINLTTYIAAGYSDFELDLRDFAPATDAVELTLLASTNGGSSYLATGYIMRTIFGTQSAAGVFSSDTTQFKIATSVGNVAGRRVDAKLSMAVRSATFSVLTNAYWSDDSGVSKAGAGGGENTTAGVNAIQVKFSSGNIASGTYFLMGLKSS